MAARATRIQVAIAMKTQQEIEDKISEIEAGYKHVLTGSLATVAINAPRALQQLAVETQLQTMHWVLGTKFKSKLRGIDR